jgi:hypothetical protein
LRITLTASATRFSEVSHDLMSSAVTQTGRFRKCICSVRGIWGMPRRRTREAIRILAQAAQFGKPQNSPRPLKNKAGSKSVGCAAAPRVLHSVRRCDAGHLRKNILRVIVSRPCCQPESTDSPQKAAKSPCRKIKNAVRPQKDRRNCAGRR